MTKILVVDDNEQNLYMLKALLDGSGYEVVTATDGAQALKEARSESPTVIVSDILMPVMDGFTLCRHWKADDRLNQIPFVFYTATYTDEHDEEFALKLGADRFLRKPAEPDEFLEVMREVIERGARVPAEPVAPPDDAEEVHLRQYNQILLRKLEEKMDQLEQANQMLEQRVAQRTADLEERNQTLETFAFSMAHDLGAPLRGIRGFADILHSDERDRLSDEGRKNLDVIIQSSDRLDQMMNDLLRYATMGRGGLGMSVVSLSHVMQRISRDFADLENETNAKLTIADNFPSVHGEPTLLNQIFSNLVRNALLYCKPDHQPEVEVAWQQKGRNVIVSVSDQGIGIHPKDCAQIFTLFQRLNSQEAYPGSGVGLGIVDRAVRLLRGRVWVESEFGVGSTFFVELPMATELL